MKNLFNLFCLITLVIITISGKAQTAAEALTKDIPITWFGLDFSHSKGVLLGATPSEMKNNYIPAINQLLLQEPEKFSIGKAFKKSTVKPDFKSVNQANTTLNIDAFEVTSKDQVVPLNESTIAEMVKQYSIADKQGIGLVFIVESMDKTSKVATFYLTFFSMPEGKIILTEKVYGKSSGFGIRNYWANTLYAVLKGNTIKNITAKYTKKRR